MIFNIKIQNLPEENVFLAIIHDSYQDQKLMNFRQTGHKIATQDF